jgi:hypothetical protein
MPSLATVVSLGANVQEARDSKFERAAVIDGNQPRSANRCRLTPLWPTKAKCGGSMHRVWLLLGAICVIDSNSLFLSPITRDVTASFEGRSAEEVMLASALYGGGTAVSARALAP